MTLAFLYLLHEREKAEIDDLSTSAAIPDSNHVDDVTQDISKSNVVVTVRTCGCLQIFSSLQFFRLSAQTANRSEWWH